MATPDHAPNETKPPRGRALPIILVVLATIIGIVSVLALWVKRQALETDTWTRTSSELLQDETIQDAVGDFIVTAIFDNVDVQGEIEAKLPPQAQALAAPAAAGLRELANRGADEALSRPKVQALWEDANRLAHQKLLALLDDEGNFVSTTGGVVTLDLTKLITEIAADVGVGGNLASKLPAEASQIKILESDQLGAAQTGVKALRTLAWVLTALTLALFALAIYLARGHRRETLRLVGFSFVAIGIVALIARNAGGNALTSALTGTAAAEGPVQNTWQIGTSLLNETAQSLIAYGVVIVLAAWLAGPTGFATSIRRGMTPYLRKPSVAYGTLAVLLALLFWWNPVVATSRIGPSILLICFAAIGVEALRRQAIREFPDRVTTGSPEGIAHGLAQRMRDARERSIRSGHADPATAAPGEERIAALERLGALRDSGLLSEEELAEEKSRILASG